jgi:cellulose synthase/poly-beta-1,6-N-acetylglucosamine synthase-like glycosyltransferase
MGLYYFSLFVAFLILYHHLIYPLLLRWLGRNTEQPFLTGREQRSQSSIHIIVPAYNEAQYIAHKIENLTQLKYPTALLRITVIGDGCTDETINIARHTAAELGERARHIEIEEHQHNRGKVRVLNAAIADSTADIVALSDVSALLNADALNCAAKHFQNPLTGVVNSVYRFAKYANQGERAYWDYQSKIKHFESNSGSVIGAHGALYFFRRKLFTTLCEDTINDDFIIPMQVVAQGYRAVQATDIIATELEQAIRTDENARRMRIAAGNLQQAFRLRRLLSPRFGAVAFNFFCGKVLRVLMPGCLLLLFIASLLLATQSLLFALLAALQSIFYLTAWLSHLLGGKGRFGLLSVVYYFTAGHWFSLVGMYRYLTGAQRFRV